VPGHAFRGMAHEGRQQQQQQQPQQKQGNIDSTNGSCDNNIMIIKMMMRIRDNDIIKTTIMGITNNAS